MNSGIFQNEGALSLSDQSELNVDSGAVLNATSSGTIAFPDDFSISVFGTLNNEGTLTVPSEPDGTFSFVVDGLLQNEGTLTLPSEPGGTLNMPSTATVDNTGTLNIMGAAALLGTWNNSGTITATPGAGGATQLAVVLNNSETGTINVVGALDVADEGAATVTNAGTINVSAGAGVTSHFGNALDNTGAIDVQSGTLSLNGTNVLQESVLSDGVSIALTGGTWEVDDGAALITAVSRFPISQNGGDIILNGPDASFPTLAGLVENSGGFTLEGGASFTTKGNLANSGALTIGPGSTLAVAGALTHENAGQTTFLIGGRPASGQYGRLTSTGAAVLDGTLAAQDAAGYIPIVGDQYPVMTFASQTGNPTFSGGQIFGAQFNPTNVVVTVAAQPVDLAVSAVTFSPATAVLGQSVTVSYTVQNLAQVSTGAGSWTDSVYLSPHAVFDSSAVLLGRTTHQGDVAAGGAYNGSVTAPLPSLVLGSYHVFVVADSRDQLPDTNRSNNIAAAAATLSVNFPVLSPGTPISGTIAPGQSLYFQITVPGGPAVQVTGSFAAAGAGAVYAGFQSVPTASTAEIAADDASQSTESLLIPGSQSGTYYLLVQRAAGSGEPAAASRCRPQVAPALAVSATFGPTHAAASTPAWSP